MGDVIEFKAPESGATPKVIATGTHLARADGRPVVIRCRHILGDCCHKCHDFADDGSDPLLTLLNDRLEVVASVCCLKHAEANNRRNKPLRLRPNPDTLSGPAPECIR